MDLRTDYRPAHQPSRIAYQSMNPMTAPVTTNDTRLVAKYGYTMNASPAATCGHRSCFLPYTNSTNPTPPGMSETKSHVGSRDMVVELRRRHRKSSIEIVTLPVLRSSHDTDPRTDISARSSALEAATTTASASIERHPRPCQNWNRSA